MPAKAKRDIVTGNPPRRGLVVKTSKTYQVEDLVLNRSVVLPALKRYPARVPGKYEIKAYVKEIDILFHGMLLRCDGNADLLDSRTESVGKNVKLTIQKMRQYARRTPPRHELLGLAEMRNMIGVKKTPPHADADSPESQDPASEDWQDDSWWMEPAEMRALCDGTQLPEGELYINVVTHHH